jgi:hypothetical protein
MSEVQRPRIKHDVDFSDSWRFDDLDAVKNLRRSGSCCPQARNEEQPSK